MKFAESGRKNPAVILKSPDGLRSLDDLQILRLGCEPATPVRPV
jgi:hypothetical protein